MSALNQLAKEVLLKYDMEVEEFKLIQNSGLKTIWKFDYNGKTACLKRLRHSKERALFSVNAQVYIRNKGGHVPSIYLNNDSEPLTEYNEQLFVVYEWIESKDLHFGKAEDFKIAMEALAQFHVDSIGYISPEDAKISSKIGKWQSQYESMKKRMLKWKDQASNNLNNNSHKAYFENIDSIIEIADMSIGMLEKSAYFDICNNELHEFSLCHQDYGVGNVIYSKEGPYVIDLDGVTYDLVIRDLRKIIGKKMQKGGGWKENVIKTTLSYYEKYNKLSPQMLELLKIDLLYPHWFFGDVKNLYKKNKSVSANKIELITKLELSKVNLLKDLF